MRAPRTKVRHWQRGAVQVEFLIVFGPLFLLMMALVQFALICTASILVHHAAARAVRAAVVVLPDDHEDADYKGDALHFLADGDGLDAYANAVEGGRFQQIRQVPVMLLGMLALPLGGAGSLSDALQLGAWEALRAQTPESDVPVAITFRDADGGYRTQYGAREQVFVTVTLLLPCAVPMASRWMCQPLREMDDDVRARWESNHAHMVARSLMNLRRYAALEATAGLPNQGR
ncbi:MAG: hypothetical protein GX146_09715 [Myxococcales bacterium]|jgi:hypothetical protein|nr:hypothetical protein [Myxococcales bacterium]